MKKAIYSGTVVHAADGSGKAIKYSIHKVTGVIIKSMTIPPTYFYDGAKIIDIKTDVNGNKLYVVEYSSTGHHPIGVLNSDVSFGYSNATGTTVTTLPLNFNDFDILNTTKYPKLPIAILLTENVTGKIATAKGDFVPYIIKKGYIFDISSKQTSGNLQELYDAKLKVWIPYASVGGKAEIYGDTTVTTTPTTTPTTGATSIFKSFNKDAIPYVGIGALAGLATYHFGYDFINSKIKIGKKGALGYVIAVGLATGIGALIYHLTSKKSGVANTVETASTTTPTTTTTTPTTGSGTLREQFIKGYNDMDAYEKAHPSTLSSSDKKVSIQEALTFFDSLKNDNEKKFFIDVLYVGLDMNKSLQGKENDQTAFWTAFSTLATKMQALMTKYGITEARATEIGQMGK
jgi:hypothetical protein